MPAHDCQGDRQSHLIIKNSPIKGFTIMEIMIVITIMGVIAAFAIPNYGKSIDKGYERTYYTNLLAIHAAQESYFLDTGKYYPGAGQTKGMDDVNTALGLSLPHDKYWNSFECSSGTDADFDCLFIYRPTLSGEWTLSVDQGDIGITNKNPCCSGGTCPSLGAC